METFRRYEKKYLLAIDQYLKLMEKLTGYVKEDKFSKTEIHSIYYDTDDYQLIRRSIEKPEYKEKLRARSYGTSKGDDPVYIELKKKLDGIVYKRRTKAFCDDVLNDISQASFRDEQVGNEIRYALNYYGKIAPKIYIGSVRTSYVARDDEKLRITFDEDLRYRIKDLSFSRSIEDRKLCDRIVMELKVAGAMPLWLSAILDEVKAYPRGFSKVGTAFENEIRRSVTL